MSSLLKVLGSRHVQSSLSMRVIGSPSGELISDVRLEAKLGEEANGPPNLL